MHCPNALDSTGASNLARFALPQPAAFCPASIANLNQYRACLLWDFRDEPTEVLRSIRLAVNEAEGLAWSTPYGHLLFPVLVEEKIQFVRHWSMHQQRVSPGLSATSTPTNPTD